MLISAEWPNLTGKLLQLSIEYLILLYMYNTKGGGGFNGMVLEKILKLGVPKMSIPVL